MKRLACAIALFALAGIATPAMAAVSTTGSLTVKFVRPIAVARTGALSFGKIVLPSAGSSTFALTTGLARSVTGAGSNAFWITSPASTVPTFTVSGEGGQAFTLVIDTTVVMTNTAAAGGTFTVNTSNDAG